MINTTGLTQYAVISALEYVSGRKLWYLPAQNGCRESWACVGPDGEWVQVFLAPEGFDESLFDRAFGRGAAQRAIDRAKGGAAQ